MSKELSRTKCAGLAQHLAKVGRGFSLVEIILASALFLVLASAFVGAFLYGQESMLLAGARTRAVFLAEEGLEAVRNIRDRSFENLADGSYGLSMTGGQWNLSGTQDSIEGFTRSIAVSTLDVDTKKIETTITWRQNLQRQGSVALTTVASNWHALSLTQADALTIDISGASLSGDNKEVRNIEIINLSSIPITIATVTVSWGNSRKIERLKIGEDTVWSKSGPGTPTGAQTSGTLLNIQDFTLEPQEDEEIDNIKFNGSMEGQTVTIQFDFSDGTTKTATVF